MFRNLTMFLQFPAGILLSIDHIWTLEVRRFGESRRTLFSEWSTKTLIGLARGFPWTEVNRLGEL